METTATVDRLEVRGGQRRRFFSPGFVSYVVSNAPAYTLIALGCIVPVVVLLGASFSAQPFGFFVPFSLQNYLSLFSDPFFISVVARTWQLAALVTLFTLALGYPIAYALSRAGVPGKTAFVAIILCPLLLNHVVLNIGWLTLLGPTGPINVALLGMGIVSEPVQFLHSLKGVVLVLVHLYLGLMVLSIMSSLEAIDPSLEEAARGLGASRLWTFLRITLPLSMPGVVTGSLLVMFNVFGAFVAPVIIGGMRVWVVSTLIFQQVSLVRWGFAAAVVVAMVTTTGIMLLALWWLPTALLRFVGFLSRWGSLQAAARGRGMSGGGTGRQRAAGRWGSSVALVALSGAIVAPIAAVMIASVNSLEYLTVLPFERITLRWFSEALNDSNYLSALQTSLAIAVVAAGAAVSLVVAGLWGAIHWSGRMLRGVGYLMMPRLVPPVALGVGLIFFYSAFSLAGSMLGLLIAHAVTSIPYAFPPLYAGARGLDPSLLEAARGLGASSATTFRRIALPLLRHGVAAAAIFAFLHSFNEFPVTVFLAGAANMTLPVEIYNQLSTGPVPSIAAVSAVLVVVGFAIFWTVMKWLGLEALHRFRPAEAARVAGPW